MIARLWWGSTPEKRKISWVSSNKMKISKRLGGLGFRNLNQFKQALLENQVWKIIRHPESLVYKNLKTRYFKDGTLLHANKRSQLSYGWNSLSFGAELLKRCTLLIEETPTLEQIHGYQLLRRERQHYSE